MAAGRKTGGRLKGVPNRKSQERDAAMQSAIALIEDTLADAFTGDAHALLVTVYKDPRQPWDLRIDCAKASLRFEKSPKPVSAEVTGADGGPIETCLSIAFVEPGGAE